MRSVVAHVPSLKLSGKAVEAVERCIPQEVPVALVYNGTTHAVMMASPADLEDYATGFSLTEGIVTTPDEIESLEIVEHERGIELRMWLAEGRQHALAERRRSIAGPTGCGLCGIESLEAAVPVSATVTGGIAIAPEDIVSAMAALPGAQRINQQTHAVHGAAFWTPSRGLVAVAEDVGRHNALDKLIGRLTRADADLGAGMVLLTSRVSVEMVQKAAAAGAPVVVAISAPTALAVETADRAGITLVAIARADSFQVFTHPERIRGAVPQPGRCQQKVDHEAA